MRKSDVYLPTPPAFWSQSDGNYLLTPKIELKLKPPKYLFETAERSASSFKLSKMCTDGTRHKDISSRIHDKSIISSHIFLLTDVNFLRNFRVRWRFETAVSEILVSTTYLPLTPSRPAAAKTTYLPPPVRTSQSYVGRIYL